MFIQISVYLCTMVKITLKQFKELTKIEGEIGAELEELTKKVKVIKKAYNKMTKILDTVRKTSNFEF